MNYRIALAFSFVAAAMLATLAPAYAKTIDHDITAIGWSVTVPADEEVKGDVTVIGGNADIAGHVDKDVTVIGGRLIQEPGSQIDGDIVAPTENLSSFIPFIPAVAASHVERENRRLTAWLAYSVIVLVAFLIFPVRVRAALDRVEHHPGLSAGVGVLALVAIFPIAVLLFISFIGWPLIPVEFLAVFAAILIGYAALSMLIGRRLYEMILPRTTPSPIAALILGLVIVAAAGMVPIIGHLVIGLVCLVGLGAAILAFVRETHFMGPHFSGPQMGGGPGPQGPGPRPPIGGPPMPAR